MKQLCEECSQIAKNALPWITAIYAKNLPFPNLFNSKLNALR